MGAPVTLMTPDPTTGLDRLAGSPAAPFATQGVAASAGATTRAATSTAVATLKASNSARKGITVFNESTAILYVKLGTGATATDYTYAVPASGYYEVPFSYTGAVTGILSANTGFAQVTELT